MEFDKKVVSSGIYLEEYLPTLANSDWYINFKAERGGYTRCSTLPPIIAWLDYFIIGLVSNGHVLKF